MTIFIAICCLPYYLFWRGENRITEQRTFLLLVLGLSFIVPFLPVKISTFVGLNSDTLSIAKYIVSQSISTDSGSTIPIASNNSGFSFSELMLYLSMLILIVSIFFFLNFCNTIRKGIRLKRVALHVERFNGIEVYIMPKGMGCFSFISGMYIDVDLYNSPNRELLLSHEEAHIRSFHFIDLLFAQIALSLQWFNPLIYFLVRELKSLHEFTADRFAINQNQRIQYLSLLLEYCSVNKTGGLLFNQFSYGCLKKRIAMITNKSQSKFENRNLKYLLTIPFIALAIFVISCTKDEAKFDNTKKIENEKVKQENVFPNISNKEATQMEDYVLLKEFLFNPKDNLRMSLILKKGVEYKFRSRDEKGSYIFQLSSGNPEGIISSLKVDANSPLSYTFIPEKTSAYHVKLFEICEPGFCPQIELLLKNKPVENK